MVALELEHQLISLGLELLKGEVVFVAAKVFREGAVKGVDSFLDGLVEGLEILVQGDHISWAAVILTGT